MASASISPSASVSPSGSMSLSISPSASVSPSGSASQSVSPSRSVSPSGSISPSGSVSPSGSLSPSPSGSVSPSGSLSPSPSASVSPSSSESRSTSPSPSLPASNYLLDGIYLPPPKTFSREFISISSDVSTLTGKTGRDLGTKKEIFRLGWEVLSKEEVDNILVILAKNTPVVFQITETNLTIAPTRVIIRLSGIEYSTLGSNYISSLELELEEET